MNGTYQFDKEKAARMAERGYTSLGFPGLLERMLKGETFIVEQLDKLVCSIVLEDGETARASVEFIEMVATKIGESDD